MNILYTNELEKKIESLRQQLAAMEDKYLVERGMLRLKRAELADSQKREVILRNYMMRLMLPIPHASEDALSVAKAVSEIAEEALAATADLDGLILCHAEPVGIGSKARGIGEDYQPLYRAWEPK